jgi:hypothetical protein
MDAKFAAMKDLMEFSDLLDKQPETSAIKV